MENSSGNKRKILFAIIGLLVGINLLLFFYNRKIDNDRTLLRANNEQIETARGELSEAYEGAISTINEYKGENNRLDSLLLTQKDALQQQRLNIQQLLQKNNLTNAELGQANALIKNLKLSSQAYVNEIENLKRQNQQLSQNNQVLKQDLQTERAVSNQLVENTKVLEQEKTELVKETVSLEQEKTELVAETEVLKKETRVLKEKINRAAVLKATNVEAVGIKFKKSGKEKETKDFKDVEKIKICYDIQENAIAESGMQELLVRIVHPEGFTLAVEDLGSGTFTYSETGENRQFTTSAEIDYLNDELQRYCTYWSYNSEYSPGNYKVEIYNFGYLIGAGGFELKKKLF